MNWLRRLYRRRELARLQRARAERIRAEDDARAAEYRRQWDIEYINCGDDYAKARRMAGVEMQRACGI